MMNTNVNISTSSDTALAMMTASQQKSLPTAKDMLADKNMESIEKAAKDFEAVFLSEMLKPMFEGISTEAPYGGGKSEEIFRGIMLQEYGKEIASSRGIGLADHVKAELLRLQAQQTSKTERTS